MRIYGLTGGTGSGKTVIADRFRELGIPVIDADSVGHEVIAPYGVAEAKVVEAFGPDILTEARIDRKKLGNIVFADPAELDRLNAIVQPAIREEIARRSAELAEQGHEFAVIDAALLGEEGKIADWVDGLILVLAPIDVRIDRLIEQRGITPEQARERIASQVPPETKLGLAKWVVENIGTLDELRQDADALAGEMQAHK